jgi:hypothetical protein
MALERCLIWLCFISRGVNHLRVTREHGVFVWPGIMKRAVDVVPSDKLFGRHGSVVGISGISSEAIEDEVVNLETHPSFFGSDDEDMPLEHVIFASGVAVGDLAWQNRLRPMLGRVLWRDAIARKLPPFSETQGKSIEVH